MRGQGALHCAPGRATRLTFPSVAPSMYPLSHSAIHTPSEPTHINLELLFNDLFLLRDRFKELGMTIKDGEIYLADLENKDV